MRLRMLSSLVCTIRASLAARHKPLRSGPRILRAACYSVGLPRQRHHGVAMSAEPKGGAPGFQGAAALKGKKNESLIPYPGIIYRKKEVTLDKITEAPGPS